MWKIPEEEVLEMPSYYAYVRDDERDDRDYPCEKYVLTSIMVGVN